MNDKIKDSAKLKALSATDEELFNEAMRGVKISMKREVNLKDTNQKTTYLSNRKRDAFPTTIRKKTNQEFSFLVAGKSGDIDHKTMSKLKRGQISPDTRLDLHGMTLKQAHSAVFSFILGAAEKRVRCLLIITGKGRISEGGGVLRNQFPQWLNHPNIRLHVIGFCEAQPRDGGGGAFYVLLRRKR